MSPLRNPRTSRHKGRSTVDKSPHFKLKNKPKANKRGKSNLKIIPQISEADLRVYTDEQYEEFKSKHFNTFLWRKEPRILYNITTN